VRTLNLGILAHVDAGKTSLTERLLYAAGVIDAIGSVDDGSTQTDSLALEQQRGITIKAAVVSFEIDSVTVNLIDTPGHPDFIAEVERVLGVLDGAVLVVSAVEGVQAQTRVLMRTLQRLKIPTLLFVNKLDRSGADPERVLREIAEKLTPTVVAMGASRHLGRREAEVTPYGPADASFTARLAELLAEHDDALLAAYVDDPAGVPYGRLRGNLAAQTGRGLVHPVFFGSAITGAGVEALMAGIAELLPAVDGDPDGSPSGIVFKVERGPVGEKIAYLRLFSGTIHTRDRLQFHRDHQQGHASDSESGSRRQGPTRVVHPEPAKGSRYGPATTVPILYENGRRASQDGVRKVTALRVFEHGSAVQRAAVGAGQIGKLWGLGDVQVGDTLGDPRPGASRHHFAPPTLESVVVPRRAADKGALHVALAQLAEQDPLINLRQDDARGEIFVSLYGEVQKEVIEATLAEEYRIEVDFRETTTICVERPVGSGEAIEVLRKDGNPFCATVGLRVEPAPPESGVSFRLEAELTTVPLYVYKSVEEFRHAMTAVVVETLRQGLYGWQVADCIVTMTHSGYISPSSTAGDFRKLTPLVLMAALQEAGTVVCEPIHRFHLEVPADTFGAVAPLLARLRAVPRSQEMRGSAYVLEGDVPAARTHELQQLVPGLTHGEGVLECAFDHYEAITGTYPTRARTDLNPLNRKEYLIHVTRRI
jgi:ribosomal protection tetracycline resistance protein